MYCITFCLFTHAYMCCAGTFEVDTANTNMLLEKRGDIINEKRIQVPPRSNSFQNSCFFSRYISSSE